MRTQARTYAQVRAKRAWAYVWAYGRIGGPLGAYDPQLGAQLGVKGTILGPNKGSSDIWGLIFDKKVKSRARSALFLTILTKIRTQILAEAVG